MVMLMSDLTPIKAIRARCLDCSGWSTKEVRECTHDECPLWEYRAGHRPKEKASLTPLKAIRQHCLGCCNGSALEVRLCPAEKCALQPYKSGHRPTTNEYIVEGDLSEKSLASPLFFTEEEVFKCYQ